MKTTALQSAGLSLQEVNRYHETGWLGPFTLLSEEEMARTRAYIDREIFEKECEVPETIRNHDRHLDHRPLWDLCAHSNLVEKIASILGPDLVLWRSNFQPKYPAVDGVPVSDEIPWHQDSAYFQLQPNVLVTAWIAIDEVTRENGCMQIIPGSHKHAYPHILDNNKTDFNREADPAYFNASNAVDLELSAGQFVLFNENALHHSYPNYSNKSRLGFTPRVTLPIVRIPGKVRGSGLDRTLHAPDLQREVAILKGRDYMGRLKIVPPPPQH